MVMLPLMREKTLTIEAGARVHFHANSGLLVTNNASIHANGDVSLDSELMENEIFFEGDRLEPGFAEVPGQWQTIWLFLMEVQIINLIILQLKIVL